MRAPAVSFARKLLLAAVVGLMACSLVPLGSAFAEGEGAAAGTSVEQPQEVSAEQVDEGSGVAPMLASGLVSNPSSFVSADVALDGEPVIGSFTVDSMTFAVTEGSDVELVGVSPDWKRVMDSQEGDGSPVVPMLASGPDGLDTDSSALALPESVTYEGVDYAVTSIGAYAFYLSGVTSVELPATVASVDDRAFRSSDVAAVEVAGGNATYSSFDGALYDAGYSSLLLIPEGKQGTVLLPKTAEMAPPSVFSHCSLVQAIAVEEGSAAFASENGLLYDASLTTLLRVPAGATDIVIHDGCTTIAAGAMETCASLATITAPASVTSISPYLFEQEPETVMAPVAVAPVEDEAESDSPEDSESPDAIPQLTAMVALSSADDDLPKVDASAIDLVLSDGADMRQWSNGGFSAVDKGEADAVGASARTDDKAASSMAVAYDAMAYTTEDDVPIVSAMITLDNAPVAYASRTTRTVKNGNLQMGGYVTNGAPNGVTFINGFFDGTVSWDSSAEYPQLEDIVTITVDKFTPWTVENSGGKYLISYTYDDVVDRCRKFSNVTPFYVTSMSTGNSEYLYDLYKTGEGGAPWTITWAGWALGGRETLKYGDDRILIGTPDMMSVQTTDYGWIKLHENAGNDTVDSRGHSGFFMGSVNTNCYFPAYVRRGYEHLGWSTTASAASATWGSGAMAATPDGVVTGNPSQYYDLYAVWAKKPGLSVNLNKNATDATDGTRTVYYWPDKGYTTSEDSTIVISPGSKLVADSPKRDGYEFDGYWSQRTGGTKYVDKDGNLTADAPTIAADATSPTWYAHWTPTQYTITLNTEGAAPYNDKTWTTVKANYTYTKEYNIESDRITLPFLLRSGYYFVGWTGDNGDTPQLSVAIDEGSIGNRAYDANYEQIYRVSYSSAHGAPARDSDSIYKGGPKIKLPSVTADEGYTFNGWESSAWTGLMAADQEVTFAGTQNVTVMASFTKIEYTITLNTQGGSVSDSSWTPATANSTYTRAFTVESAAVILPEPKRPGYIFTGWTGSNGTTPQTSVTVPMQSTGSRDYEAHWKAGTFTVKLDANGGSGGDEIIYEKFNDGWYTSHNAEPKYAVTKVSVPKSEATEGNFVFNGYFWTDSEGNRIQCIDSTGKITAAASQFTQDATLVAEWASIAGVGIHANGGYLKYNSVTWQGDFCHQISNVKKCEILPDNSLYTLATDEVPRTIGSGSAEWELLGWSTSPNGPLLTAGDQPTDKNVVYYAQWKRPTQLVVFANGGALTFPYNNNWSGDGAWQFSSTSKFTVGGNAELTVGGTDRNREVTVPEGYDQMLLGWSWTSNGAILEPGTYVISDTTLLYAVWSGPVEPWLYPNSGALRYSNSCAWDDETWPYVWSFPNSLQYVICEDGSAKVFDETNIGIGEGRHTVADDRKTNRVLLGWARTPTGPMLPSGTYGGSGRIDLYAFWQTSVVGFDPNGGAGGQSDSLPVTVGEAMPVISKEKPTRAGYLFKGWFDGPDYEQARQYYTEECDSARQWNIGCDATLYAGWEPISYTVSLEGAAGEDLGTFTVKYGEDLELPKLESQGWIFKGWEDAETMVVHQPGAVQNLRSEDGAHVTLRAKRVAAVSADAPIDVTVSVDLLGIEDQVPASGYIESRSGGALKVAAVDFAPLDGAAALFGSRTADVALEALAGERATSAAVSFSLGSSATEADASKLAAFALPDGFGTSIPIGYRFRIPDDVLSSIDPARFEQVTTPVCSVYYTVALASMST